MRLFAALTGFLWLLCADVAKGITVSINATAGQSGSELKDQFGSDLPAGKLALLVIDTAADGIDPWAAGPFTLESFHAGTDEYVAGSIGSIIFGETSIAQFASENASDPALAQNQPYYILWFPNSASTDTTMNLGDAVGATRDVSWVLPADSGTNSGLPAADGGLAAFTVIPEPEAFALIESAMVGLLILRRRCR
jgi:hypothetical protein